MLRFDAWNTKTLTFSDLPTVRDVLSRSDRTLVADALYERYEFVRSMDEDAPVPERSEVADQTAGILDQMLSTSANEGSKTHVIVAQTMARENRRIPAELFLTTTSRLVRREHLALYAAHLDATVPVAHPPMTGYDYELDPWEQILSYRVYAPERLSEHERYQLVADILWEATFFGVGHEEAESMRCEVAANLDEQTADSGAGADATGEDEESFSFDDLDALDFLEVRTKEERAYERHMADVYESVWDTLQSDFYRDCVTLSKRLA